MPRAARWFAVALLAFAASASAQELQLDAQQVAGMLRDANRTEVEFAQQVMSRTTSTEVRDYARQLATDHQRALDQLEQTAKSAGLDLDKFQKRALPRADQQVDDSLAAMRQAILASQGKQLDQLFLGYSLMEHDRDLQVLTDAQQRFRGSPLGNLATRMLPMVRDHRARAYLLLGRTAPRQAREPAPSRPR